jgi:hypothetical protein
MAPLQPAPIDVPQDGPDGLFATVWQRFFISLRAVADLWKQQPFLTFKASTDLTSAQNLGLLTTGYLKGTVAGGVSTISSAASIPVADGGTGAGTFTAHGVMLGEGTSPLGVTAVGATKTVLTGVTGADPAFSSAPEVVSMTVDTILTADSPTFVVDATNHRVGILQATPLRTLDVGGNLMVRSAPSSVGFQLGTTAAVNRWLMRLEGVEGGANSGSDWALSSRDDSGASLVPDALLVTRATGNVLVKTGLTVDTPSLSVDAVNHRVGVGTTTPSQAFHAVGGNATGFFIDNNGSQFTEIDFGHGGAIRGNWNWDENNTVFNFSLASGTYTWAFVNGTISIARVIAQYQGVATAGIGVPAIYGEGRAVGAVAAVASVATYTVGAADGTFRVSANVNVTTATLHSFSVTCSYTDETNTPRVLTLPFVQLGGVTLVGTITNATGAGPYEGVSLTIRAKTATTITIATSGTFTTIVYNVEGVIEQVA